MSTDLFNIIASITLLHLFGFFLYSTSVRMQLRGRGSNIGHVILKFVKRLSNLL